jgi:hypothetical protein
MRETTGTGASRCLVQLYESESMARASYRAAGVRVGLDERNAEATSNTTPSNAAGPC